jgi:CDP-alcohol phosphatidyltransferase-like enzyme
MSPGDWDAFSVRCQKPGYRLIGNWFARRVSRPLALRVTWILLPTGISAHAVTFLAWACAVAAAVAFGCGGSHGWLVGAGLLQLWYLLDHVDGQVARFHDRESLDGVQLDYLMHHTVDILIPCGLGYGLFQASDTRGWLVAGLAWGIGTFLLGLEHDARSKAFIQRLKRLEGELRVIGGGGGRPAPAPPVPVGWLRRLAWLGRKACEAHVMMNLAAGLALMTWLVPGWQVLRGVYVALMAILALSLALVQIARNLRRQAAESEFAAWYRAPEDQVLVLERGYWKTVAINAAPLETGAIDRSRSDSSPDDDRALL